MAHIKSSSLSRSASQCYHNRPRLNTILKNAFLHQVILVSAPSGYGKTKTVHSYLEKKQYTAHWVNCTSLDNYPAHFLATLSGVLGRGNELLENELLHIGVPDTVQKMDFFLHAIENELVYSENTAIVFDGMHFLENPTALDIIYGLIDTLPKEIKIVLITRNVTRLDILSLHQKGHLSILSEGDLAFTKDEIRDYFTRSELSASEKVIDTLLKTSAGWPIVINLFATKISDETISDDEAVSYVLSFVHDLVEQKIFCFYPRWLQKMYIQVSLLDDMPKQVLRILVGDMEEELVKSFEENVLVQFNGYEDQFRFHTVLADFLAKKQATLSEEDRKKVFQKVADWYNSQGDLLNAITYYQKAGNPQETWNVILKHGINNHNSQTSLFLLNAIENFPYFFMFAHPLITVYRSLLLIILHKPSQAQEELLKLEAHLKAMPKSKESNLLLGETYLALAHANMRLGSYSYANYYKKAARLLPAGSSVLGPELMYVANNHVLYLSNAEEPNFEKYLAVFSEVMPAASEVMNGCGSGAEFLAAAESMYLRLNINKTEEYAHRAIQKAAEKKQTDIICNSYFALVRIYVYKGDFPKVKECLDSLKKHPLLTPAGHGSFYDVVESWFFAKIDLPEKTAPWIMENIFEEQTSVGFGIEQLVKANIMLRKNEYFELLGFLDRLEILMASRNQLVFQICVLVLKAICLYRCDNITMAKKALTSIYQTVAPSNLIAPLVEAGKDMRSLIGIIRRNERHGIPEEWLDMIQKKASVYAKRQNHLLKKYLAAENLPFEEPLLSKRELEILECMAQGLTRMETSETLGISMNTVKGIIKNIYEKLDAVNRAEAIHTAVEKGII